MREPLVDKDELKVAFVQNIQRDNGLLEKYQKENFEKILVERYQIILEVIESTSSKLRKMRLIPAKRMIRKGIHVDYKEAIWAATLGVPKLKVHERDLNAAIRILFDGELPDPLHPPLFGGALQSDSLFLTSYGHKMAETILYIIGHEFPNITYSPFIPNLVLLFLHFANQDVTLGMITSMIKNSLPVTKPWTYLPLSEDDCFLFTFVFLEILKQQLPKLNNHICKLPGAHENWLFFWHSVFTSCFLGYLPLPSIFHFLDCFCLEGVKIFYRFGIAILKVLERPLMETHSFLIVIKTILTYLSTCQLGTFEDLLHLSFTLKIDRAQIQTLRDQSIFEVAKVINEIPVHRPLVLGDSTIIVKEDLDHIIKWLPSRYNICNLDMIFSTRLHGCSINTFYNLCYVAPTIVLIKTTQGEKFGAFLTHSWSARKAKSFFGQGECFLFKLGDKPAYYPWVPREEPSPNDILNSDFNNLLKPNTVQLTTRRSFTGQVILQPASKANGSTSTSDYFMCGEKDFFAVGGGEGKFGLWVDHELKKGTTERCSTFQNEPLVKSGLFDILVLECFALV